MDSEYQFRFLKIQDHDMVGLESTGNNGIALPGS